MAGRVPMCLCPPGLQGVVEVLTSPVGEVRQGGRSRCFGSYTAARNSLGEEVGGGCPSMDTGPVLGEGRRPERWEQRAGEGSGRGGCRDSQGPES